MWELNDMRFALIQWRDTNAMTQEQTANIIGISRNYLSQIERGTAKNISMDVYVGICELIGLPKHKPDSLNNLFVEMYTAYAELAGVTGCDPCLEQLGKWQKRYMAITGHALKP